MAGWVPPQLPPDQIGRLTRFERVLLSGCGLAVAVVLGALASVYAWSNVVLDSDDPVVPAVVLSRDNRDAAVRFTTRDGRQVETVVAGYAEPRHVPPPPGSTVRVRYDERAPKTQVRRWDDEDDWTPVLASAAGAGAGGWFAVAAWRQRLRWPLVAGSAPQSGTMAG